MTSGLLSDFRFALRALLARPAFTLVATLSLALGIGVNTAVYSLIEQMLLRPLAVAAPEHLVNMSAPGIKRGSTSNNHAGPRDAIFSYPMFRSLEADERLQTALSGIAAHRSFSVNLGVQGQTSIGNGMLVSGGYFEVLGLQPALGRLLDRADDAGEARVAVLSHAYWRNALGASPAVLNQTLVVNGQALTVVGVAPPGFHGTTFGSAAQIFAPISLSWELQPGQRRDDQDWQSYWVYLFARLAPEVTRLQAEQALNPLYRGLVAERELPQSSELSAADRAEYLNKQIELADGSRGQSSVPARSGTPLTLLQGAAALVLLIACLNIANLLLARGAARAGEIALRASIGASRSRLLRQLLAESALLAVAGAVASLPAAALTSSLLIELMPSGAQSVLSAAINAQALQFTALLALTTVMMFGLFPAVQLARTQPIGVLRGDTSQATASKSANRFRIGLAVAQIAFSMSALVLAGLFGRSLMNLYQVELGLQTEVIASFSVAPARNGYSPERSAILIDQIEQELLSLPGVSAASSSMVPLLSGSDWGSNVSIEGLPPGPPEEMSSFYNIVGDDYFATLGVPLLAGRNFQPGDTLGAPKVAIVNRRFAERYGLGAQPIGKRMAVGSQDQLDIEIIGLIEDSKYANVREATQHQFFLPRRQNPRESASTFYVRSSRAPEALLNEMQAAVARLDPNLPVDNLRSMQQVLENNLLAERVVGTLASAFALLATLLAALGLYGVLAFNLSLRMREFGLRLALGAQPARLKSMVLKQVARMAGAGALLGLALALALGSVARSLLFEIEGHDPVVLCIAAIVLGLVALASSWLPARRAGEIDPMTALRHD